MGNKRRTLKPEVKKRILRDNILVAEIMKTYNVNIWKIERAFKLDAYLSTDYSFLQLMLDYLKKEDPRFNTIDDLLIS
jgi:hypothetical protein